MRLGPKTGRVATFGTFEDLWSTWGDADLILVDVPIGLRDAGPTPRPCDVAARRVLGPPRASSVFPAPSRPSLRGRTHEEASALNFEATGKKLSVQAFGIVPKIRDVDDFLASNREARDRVRELHPEVCFWALNGRRPMEHKKTKPDGRSERFELLNAMHPGAAYAVIEAAERYRRKDVGHDDVLDALVAAVTGVLGNGSLSTLPEAPERDSRGLPMEMVYWVP